MKSRKKTHGPGHRTAMRRKECWRGKNLGLIPYAGPVIAVAPSRPSEAFTASMRSHAPLNSVDDRRRTDRRGNAHATLHPERNRHFVAQRHYYLLSTTQFLTTILTTIAGEFDERGKSDEDVSY
jgi:hypothetical protein